MLVSVFLSECPATEMLCHIKLAKYFWPAKYKYSLERLHTYKISRSQCFPFKWDLNLFENWYLDVEVGFKLKLLMRGILHIFAFTILLRSLVEVTNNVKVCSHHHKRNWKSSKEQYKVQETGEVTKEIKYIKNNSKGARVLFVSHPF